MKKSEIIKLHQDIFNDKYLRANGYHYSNVLRDILKYELKENDVKEILENIKGVYDFIMYQLKNYDVNLAFIFHIYCETIIDGKDSYIKSNVLKAKIDEFRNEQIKSEDIDKPLASLKSLIGLESNKKLWDLAKNDKTIVWDEFLFGKLIEKENCLLSNIHRDIISGVSLNYYGSQTYRRLKLLSEMNIQRNVLFLYSPFFIKQYLFEYRKKDLYGDYVPETDLIYPYFFILRNPKFKEEKEFLSDFFIQLIRFQKSSIKLAFEEGYIRAAEKARAQYSLEKPNFKVPEKKEPPFYLRTRKMKYKINDIVKLTNGKALIVGTKTEPYFPPPAFNTPYYPRDGFDFIILNHKGTIEEDVFEGKDEITENQIISFVKHLDFKSESGH